MAVGGLMHLAKTDLLRFPKANVYWEKHSYTTNGKENPAVLTLDNPAHGHSQAVIKINKNIFHGTCFQPYPRVCSVVAFTQRQVCFWGENNVSMTPVLWKPVHLRALTVLCLHLCLRGGAQKRMRRRDGAKSPGFWTDVNFFQSGAPFHSLVEKETGARNFYVVSGIK